MQTEPSVCPGRVHDPQRQRTDRQLIAVVDGSDGVGLRGLLAEAGDLLAQLLHLLGDLDVLGRFALPVAQEVVVVRVQHDAGAGRCAQPAAPLE